MNKNRLRGVLSHRLFIILLLLLQIAFFGYLVLSGSESSWLVSLFFSLVSMLVAIHVVSKHEKPGYKLTWVFTILTLPIFGGAFYLMMRLQPSVRRFRKQVESSQEALTRRLPRHEGALAGAEAQGPCAVRLARYLESGQLEGLLVVVERSANLPGRILGKPVVVLGLNRLWGVALP